MLLADLSSQSLTTLRSLVRSDAEKRSEFRSSGGVELLLAKLAKTTDTQNTPHDAHDAPDSSAHRRAELLFTLAFCCDTDAREYVREVGGLTTAASILQQALPYTEAFECSTYAIGLLANYSYANKVILLRKGVLSLLHQILTHKASRGQSRTLLNASNLLKILCEECPPMQDEAVRSGVLESLCIIMVEETELSCHAAGAIAGVIYGHPRGQTMFLGSAAFQALPGVVQSAPSGGGLDAARCLYACLKGCSAAGERMEGLPLFHLVQNELNRFLAQAAAEFAVKEVRNGVTDVTVSPRGVVTHTSASKPAYAGVVCTVLQLENLALHVVLDIEGETDVCIFVSDLSPHRSAEGGHRITLYEEKGGQMGRPLASGEHSVLQFRNHGAGEAVGYLLQVSGGEGCAVAVFANGVNEESRWGGVSGTVVEVAGQQEVQAPPPPPTELSTPPSVVSMNHVVEDDTVSVPYASNEADEIKQQIADLARKVGLAPHAWQEEIEKPATNKPTSGQSLHETNRALRAQVEALQLEGAVNRQALAEQANLVRELARGREVFPPESEAVSEGSVDGVSLQGDDVGGGGGGGGGVVGLQEDVATVAAQMKTLEDECVANTQQLAQFLSQITELRYRMTLRTDPRMT